MSIIALLFLLGIIVSVAGIAYGFLMSKIEITAAAACLAVGLLIGMSHGMKKVHDIAVESGVALYSVEKDGKVKIIWLNNSENQP